MRDPRTPEQQAAIDAVEQEAQPFNNMADLARELAQSVFDDVYESEDVDQFSGASASYTGGQ